MLIGPTHVVPVAACRAVTEVVDIPVDLARTIGLEFQSLRTTKSPTRLRGRRVHRCWNLEHVQPPRLLDVGPWSDRWRLSQASVTMTPDTVGQPSPRACSP